MTYTVVLKFFQQNKAHSLKITRQIEHSNIDYTVYKKKTPELGQT